MVTLSALDTAIQRAQNYLLSIQREEGYWVGELQSDVSVTAGFIPLMKFMGISHPARQQKVVNYLKQEQLPDGSWNMYWGGKGDLNVTIQAYFALKLAGIPPQEPLMSKAKEFILSKGGINQSHTFTKLLLAPFGQFPWHYLPSLPPEMLLLPNSFFFNIYDFASWARATIVALSILMAKKPVYHLSPQEGIKELYLEPPHSPGHPSFSWKGLFLLLDFLIKAYEKLPISPLREKA